MKIKYIPFIFHIFLQLIFLCSCEAKYNFDYEPPHKYTEPEEIFPLSIKKTGGRIARLSLPEDYIGYDAFYAEGNISMRIIRCPEREKANLYFGTVIIEEFKRKKVHTYNNLKGRWKATGKDEDGRRWLAWVNETWIFVLSGSDKEHFDLAVRVCGFVSIEE